jgi:hypothetical protein
MFATFSGPRATQLVLTTPPSGAVAGASFGVQPVGELRDTRGIRAVGCGGAVIRAELVSGPGALQGVTTATVDASGAFAFSTLGVTTAGTYSLRFVVVGFAPNATASGLVASAGGSISRGLASAVVRVTTVGLTRGLTAGLGALNSQLPGSGWSLADDNPHSVVAPSGWSLFTGGPPSGQIAPVIVTDATAPDGEGSSVIQFTYEGVGDGWEPSKLYFNFSSAAEVFWATYVKWQPSWTWPSSSGFKMFIFGSPIVGWLGTGRYTGTPYNNADAGVGRGAYDSNGFSEAGELVTPIPFLNGQWYKLQLWIKCSAPQRIVCWVNDTKIQDSADNPGGAFTVGASTLNELQFPATRGGGTPGPGLAGDLMRHARTTIWTR